MDPSVVRIAFIWQLLFSGDRGDVMGSDFSSIILKLNAGIFD
jgi:hypothetical protein